MNNEKWTKCRCAVDDHSRDALEQLEKQKTTKDAVVLLLRLPVVRNIFDSFSRDLEQDASLQT
jgi:hypothetical protein